VRPLPSRADCAAGQFELGLRPVASPELVSAISSSVVYWRARVRFLCECVRACSRWSELRAERCPMAGRQSAPSAIADLIWTPDGRRRQVSVMTSAVDKPSRS
jgi:hypothetical protein